MTAVRATVPTRPGPRRIAARRIISICSFQRRRQAPGRSTGNERCLALRLELIDDAARDPLGEDHLTPGLLHVLAELAGPEVLEQCHDRGRPWLPVGRQRLDVVLVEETGDVGDDRVEVAV